MKARAELDKIDSAGLTLHDEIVLTHSLFLQERSAGESLVRAEGLALHQKRMMEMRILETHLLDAEHKEVIGRMLYLLLSTSVSIWETRPHIFSTDRMYSLLSLLLF